MDSRKAKGRIIIAIGVLLAIVVGNAIGTEVALRKEMKRIKDTHSNIEDSVEQVQDTIKLRGYNTIKDYQTVLGNNKVTKFVEPKYIVKVDNNGISSINSEENVVYYNDSDGNESFISIQYETTKDGIERQVIYGIKLKEENDKLALLKAEEVFEKLGYSDELDMLDNTFSGAVSKYDGQLGSYGLKKKFINGVIRVGTAKKLLDSKISYQMSLGHCWKELADASIEQVENLEYVTDSDKILSTFQHGYNNIFEMKVESIINLGIISSKIKEIIAVNNTEQSIALSFNEDGLAWVSIKNTAYAENGTVIEAESRVLKSANNTLTAYITLTSSNREENIGDIAIRVIDGLDKYKSEVKKAESSNNNYIKLEKDRNNSSLAIIKKEDSVVFDLAQTYDITVDANKE